MEGRGLSKDDYEEEEEDEKKRKDMKKTETTSNSSDKRSPRGYKLHWGISQFVTDTNSLRL